MSSNKRTTDIRKAGIGKDAGQPIWQRIAKRLLPLAFWLGLWAILAGVMKKPLILPSPWAVAGRLWQLLGEGSFYLNMGASLLRVLAGMVLGVLAGILLAVLCCRWTVADWLLAPVIRIIRTVPVASFIILILLWVSKGKVPGVISGLVVLPLIWESVCMGIRTVPENLREMAKAYGMSRGRIHRYVELPAILPHVMTGLSNAVGLSWKSGVAAEVLCVPMMAIGTRVYESKLYLETVDLFAWTIAVVALSMAIEALIRLAVKGAKGYEA